MNLKSDLPKKPSVFNKIDFKKIGTGAHFTEGKFNSTRGLGLKGQLGNLKRSARFTATANLSKKNLQTMYDLINERLKNKAVNSKVGISARDKKMIMSAAYKLTKQHESNFSREDMEDLRKVVDELKIASEENILSKKENSSQSVISQIDKNNFTIENKKNLATGQGAIPNRSVELSTNLSAEFLSKANTDQPALKENPKNITDEPIVFENINRKKIDQDQDKIPSPSEAKDLPI